MSVNGWWRKGGGESRPTSDGPSSGQVLSQGYTRSFSSRNPRSSSWSAPSARDFLTPAPAHSKVKIDGISLVEDFDLAAEIKARLRYYNRAPRNYLGFPINASSFLTMEDIQQLQEKPYLCSPRPKGAHFLLYVDPEGNLFMEHQDHYVYKVAQDRAPRIPNDTILFGMVVRKKLRDEATLINEPGAKGKLMFVILDATRVNGTDLTQESLLGRISAVKMEIMEPRKSKSICVEQEVFDLDITKYEEASRRWLEECVTKEFQDRYEYPLDSFVFYPRDGGFLGARRNNIFHWIDNVTFEFSFRLRISNERESTADLYVLTAPGKGDQGPNRDEVKFGKIDLTDELRALNESLIVCDYVDRRWVFVQKCHQDRLRPNTKLAIEGKMRVVGDPVSFETLLTCFE